MRTREREVTFVDSSALLRWCFGEGDLSLVIRALTGPCASSAVTVVEVPTAIHARYHRGEVSAAARDGYLAAGQALVRGVSLAAVGENVRVEAVRIAEQFLVRALDAIQIASVTEARQRRPRRPMRFCTADRRQAEAAVALLGANAVDLMPPYVVR